MLNDEEVKAGTAVDLGSEGSDIAAFFSGKRVLLTGGLGFMGSVFLEKLLRSCPQVDRVYLLVRPSRGKNVQTKVDECFGNMLFDALRKRRPDFIRQVTVLSGDVSQPQLGLSPSTLSALTPLLNVIIHAAATVRFDEPLSRAVLVNVLGTRHALNLAERCPRLVAFLHLSSALCNCPQKHVQEKVYAPAETPDRLLELMERTGERELEKMTPRLLGDYPNTYAYTKQIAEYEVTQHPGVNASIFRPSIVMATYLEPLCGWSNNLYGPTGFLVGAGSGVLRTMQADPAITIDLVPVDMCAAAMLAAVRKTALTSQLRVYNCVSSPRNPITLREFEDSNKRYGILCPTVKCVWYYCFRMVPSARANLIYSIFLHFIPALFVDAGLLILGKQPQALKLYKKIFKINTVLAYFTTQQWQFDDNETQALWNELSPIDKRVFPFSMSLIDWERYASTHFLGLRVYLMKDEASTIPVATIRWKRFKFLHESLKIVFSALILWVAYSFLRLILGF